MREKAFVLEKAWDWKCEIQPVVMRFACNFTRIRDRRETKHMQIRRNTNKKNKRKSRRKVRYQRLCYTALTYQIKGFHQLTCVPILRVPYYVEEKLSQRTRVVCFPKNTNRQIGKPFSAPCK